MCGIAGFICRDKINYDLLQEMVQSIRHRGPDEIGFYFDGNIGLGQSRLSIMDPQNGRQPLTSEDDSIVVIFNGEIYNYVELRQDLLGKGHVFKNNSDTAIIPHMYEEYGTDMFRKLNGQFAIAIWDNSKKQLVLGRDRLGEKPIYYYHQNDTFCFASEAKAILKSGLVSRLISPVALKQVFTYWTTLSDRSIFENIYQVPQGCYLIFKNCCVHLEAYWNFSYSKNNMKYKDGADFTDELDRKLTASVRARMMSDVPISFYLSGGLDSSLITSIAARISNQRLNTFSITFDDTNYDESKYQEYMSRYLETNHQRVEFSKRDIPSILKDVIFHTETPLLRSGAFPMYVLAKLVRSNDIKVVLSGEGSDELFGGYDIFREVKIRDFCSKNLDSKFRASLYKRVNNFVQSLEKQPLSSLSLHYNKVDSQSWFSSHYTRWKVGTYSQQFFSSEYREQMKEYDEYDHVEKLLPPDFMTWTTLQRAQYLEIIIFFTNYLLSSQGDRVSMAASVECRYPFLDYEVVDFANSLPDTVKIKALKEKYIVKKLAQKYLPDMIVNRRKFPYRAPINIAELMKDEYLREVISSVRLKQYRVFNPLAVERFLASTMSKEIPNERDSMLFMGILTTQILCEQFSG